MPVATRTGFAVPVIAWCLTWLPPGGGLKNLFPAVANGRVVRELAYGPPGPGLMKRAGAARGTAEWRPEQRVESGVLRRVHRGPVEDAVQHANLKCAPGRSH